MAAEEPNTVNFKTLKADPSTPDDATLDEIDDQVYAALVGTSNEAFDIVLGTAMGGVLEVWRLLHRRCNPGSLLREMLIPGKSTIENLRHHVETLEEWARRRCDWRDHTGQS